MSTPYPVRLAGEELWLLPEKAIYWPAQQALLIADVHFGKAAAYRSLGQPVPQGTTASNIAVLNGLLAALPCRQLIFLGDFLHGPGSHAKATLSALAEWRARHRDLPMTLIRGNHDKRAGDPPDSLNIRVVPEPLLLGPFALQHEPTPHGSRPRAGRACAPRLPTERSRSAKLAPGVLQARRRDQPAAGLRRVYRGLSGRAG